jgi:hypothetical protein
MSNRGWLTFGLVVGFLLTAAALSMVYSEVQRRRRLRRVSELESEGLVIQEGDGRLVLSTLESRRRKVGRRGIHPLLAQDRERLAVAWERTQLTFVDDPVRAIHEADRLVSEVLRAQGYSGDNFKQSLGDLSLEHPDVTRDHRVGHGITIASDKADVSAEKLRRAILHYRALFADLLERPRMEREAA